MSDSFIHVKAAPKTCGECPLCYLITTSIGIHMYLCKVGSKEVDGDTMSKDCPVIFAPANQTPPSQPDAELSELTEDLDAMENLCIKMEEFPDIWPTRVIRTICKVLYRHLMREAKRMKRRRREQNE